MKKICIILPVLFFALQGIAQVTVDTKGTKILIDSSKWKISGTNIYSKNTGNTGIGTSTPAYKLDINAAVNPLRLMGVQNGNTVTDSVLTIAGGVVKKLGISSFSKNDSTTASNGLTLSGKDIQLGGNLTQSSTITSNSNTLTFATGGTALNITGLTAGAATDSIVTINTTTGRINRINASTLNKNDSTTASNGLTLSGKNIVLGGNLTQSSTITSNSNTLTFATGGTALNITGLTAGATTDSLVTINASTGRINRINASTLNKNDSTTASNGLTLSGKNITLGGNLTQSSTITSNSNTLTFATGGTALNITGLTAGATTDSLVTINASTGRINRINVSSLNKNDSTTASNGLTLSGKDIQLGGNLTQPSTITSNSNTLTFATGGTALNITGLTAGATTDSLVTINPSTGRINRINMAILNKNDSTTASNGLTLSANEVILGGSLTQASTITTSASNTLAVTGLQTGSSSDSILVLGAGSVIKKLAQVSFPKLLVDARRITSAYAPVSAYDTIVYNSAGTNVGTAYNTSTGVFTAPATGLYEIIINNSYALTSTSSNTLMQLGNRVYVNGSVDMERTTNAFRSSTGTVNTTVSGNTIVSITSGQTVFISAGGVSSSTTVAALYGSGQHVLKIIQLQ